MGYFWYGSRRHSVGRPPKWVQNLLQKGAAESHIDPDPQGAAESHVEPDLSGQGTAESRREVEPAPAPTDESNSDPVEVSAESHSEPGTMTDASDCEPVLVDESTEKLTSPLFILYRQVTRSGTRLVLRTHLVMRMTLSLMLRTVMRTQRGLSLRKV